MINWEYYNIKIDNTARLQFEHYFNDIKLILDKQNLVFKEHEIVTDLEDHIIDYIRNKDIATVSFKEAMEILAELGSPEEYADFSNLPNLIDEVNKSKQKKPIPLSNASANLELGNPILCRNCNTKNEENSAFCIQCGAPLKKNPEGTSGNLKNPFSYVFRTNPEYFFGILTYFLLEFLLLLGAFLFEQQYFDITNFLTGAVIANEFILVPGIFLYRLVKIGFTRKELAQFLSTYLLKIFTIITLVFIPLVLGSNINTWIIIILLSVILLSYPIVLTKLVFFTNYSVPINFNRVLNEKSKVGYIVSTIILIFSAFIIYYHPDDLVIAVSFVFIFFIFVSYVCIDFVISFLLSNEKIMKTGDSSKITYGTSYITTIPRKISVLSDQILIILLLCNIGLIFLFIESVYLNTIKSMFGDFLTLFTIFIFSFVFVDLYYDFYYNKSSNVLLLTLGMYYLDFAIIYSYMVSTTSLSFLLNNMIGIPNIPVNPSIFYNGLPLIIILFIVITGVFFPVLSLLVLNNDRIKAINEIPNPNNKIVNVLLIICYFILVVLVVNTYNYSIYLAGLTSLLGLSVLLLIKPFFNFINFFFMYKLNIQKYPSRLVHQ